MYNRKKKRWEARETSEESLTSLREAAERNSPEAMFLLADSLLAEGPRGGNTVDAVYWMERAAALEYPRAALAMGQMFWFGWGVGQSWRKAFSWYEKAAALGDEDAKAEVERIRKMRRRVLFSAVCGAAAVALLLVLVFGQAKQIQGILVSRDTELVEATTFEEFTEALNDVIRQYDDELVITGQRQTNRLLLTFEGTGLDLRLFPAATVIADEENFVVIQFATEEEADACLNALREMDSVLFVNMDGYRPMQSAIPSVASEPITLYDSPYTGTTYYSWGVEALGYDQLASWMMSERMGENEDPVIVAILDTGTEPCDETRERILEGASLLFPQTKGWVDREGHGTHVGGTVLDCTRGLNVVILPVQTLGTYEEYAEILNLPNLPPNTDLGALLESYVIQAIRYAMQRGAKVINMSLGGPCFQPVGPNEDCSSGGIDFYIHQAVESGVTVVVSAGNGDENGRPVNTNAVCPAHLTDAIVVGAIDENGNIAPFSNYGYSVDVCAPGTEILSNFPGDSLALEWGTSMAAPHISALAAMLRIIHPDRSPHQIEKYIKDYCMTMEPAEYYGRGIPLPPYFIEGEPPTEAERRRDDAGGASGEITITMSWDTMDDLDLHCLTPDGSEIYFLNQNAGGGALDVDMQRKDEELVPEPVENIVFPNPNHGEYRVWVENYNDRTPGGASSFVVEVKVGSRRDIFFDALDGSSQQAQITAFTY